MMEILGVIVFLTWHALGIHLALLQIYSSDIFKRTTTQIVYQQMAG